MQSQRISIEVTSTGRSRLAAALRGGADSGESLVAVHWVLVLDGRPLRRASTRATEVEWQLHESGLYLIQATIEIKGQPSRLIRSEAHSYFGSDSELEFEHFLRSRQIKNSPFGRPLQYARLQDPFRELLVVGAKAGSMMDENRVREAARVLNETLGLSLAASSVESFEDLRVHVLCANPPLDVLGERNGNVRGAWLSGVIHRHRSILRSPEDLCELMDRGGRIQDLQHSTGSYTLVLATREEVRVTADYFGFNRWYLFEDRDFIVAANGYHLLLEFLIGAGQHLSLNRTSLLSQFWSMRCQATMQNFSRHMGVVGVRQMTPAERLVLDGSGWNLERTPLGAVLADRSAVSATEFAALLKLGASEVVAHVDAAVGDGRNEHVLVDLSGGLDSRVVYAALESVRPSVDTTVCSINSRDTPGSRDLEIALSLVGDRAVRWNDSPVVREWLSAESSDQVSRSHYLGTYYSQNLWLSRLVDDKTVACNGACGEILARPYLSRNLFGTPCDSAVDVSSFMDELWHQWGHLSDTSCQEVLDAWKDSFSQELIAQDCESPYEALDRMYMTFRHAYHFDPSHAHSYIHLNFMPMQSPALFMLHHKMYAEMRGLELQGELLRLLDPDLAAHEYESERDNRDMCRVLDRKLDQACPETVARQREAWSAALSRKRSSARYENGRPSSLSSLADKQLEAARCALHRLLNASELRLSSTLKRDVFRALNQMQGNPGKVRFAYNRFMSILDQVDIVQRSRTVGLHHAAESVGAVAGDAKGV